MCTKQPKWHFIGLASCHSHFLSLNRRVEREFSKPCNVKTHEYLPCWTNEGICDLLQAASLLFKNQILLPSLPLMMAHKEGYGNKPFPLQLVLIVMSHHSNKKMNKATKSRTWKKTVSIKNQNPNHLIKNQMDKLDTHFSKGGTPQIACKYLEESMTAMLMRGRCGEIETYNNGRWGCKLMLLGLSLGKWVLVVPKKMKRTARWFSYSTPIRAPKNSKSANYIDSCTSIFTAIILTIGAVQNRPKTSFNT